MSKNQRSNTSSTPPQAGAGADTKQDGPVGDTEQGASVADSAKVVETLMNSSSTVAEKVMKSPEGGQVEAAAKALHEAGARPALRVVSRAPSFRRAGREFSNEPTDIPADELSPEHLELLENDPDLVTSRVYIPAPQES